VVFSNSDNQLNHGSGYSFYLTALVSDYSVISLYVAVIFCFPAYLYLDMKRQAAGKFCVDAPVGDVEDISKEKTRNFRSYWL
jgi:hypothetical protein